MDHDPTKPGRYAVGTKETVPRSPHADGEPDGPDDWQRRNRHAAGPVRVIKSEEFHRARRRHIRVIEEAEVNYPGKRGG